MLLTYQEIFGDQFLDKVAFIFTHWSNNKVSIKDRKKQGITQGSIQQDISRDAWGFGAHKT
jgi:hypothetical protein